MPKRESTTPATVRKMRSQSFYSWLCCSLVVQSAAARGKGASGQDPPGHGSSGPDAVAFRLVETGVNLSLLALADEGLTAGLGLALYPAAWFSSPLAARRFLGWSGFGVLAGVTAPELLYSQAEHEPRRGGGGWVNLSDQRECDGLLSSEDAEDYEAYRCKTFPIVLALVYSPVPQLQAIAGMSYRIAPGGWSTPTIRSEWGPAFGLGFTLDIFTPLADSE